MSFLAEVLAGRGGPAVILFRSGQRFEAPFVTLVNGGVMHVDGDGAVRWHPERMIEMVIWKEEEDE
jgi:hypothetical protein